MLCIINRMGHYVCLYSIDLTAQEYSISFYKVFQVSLELDTVLAFRSV